MNGRPLSKFRANRFEFFESFGDENKFFGVGCANHETARGLLLDYRDVGSRDCDIGNAVLSAADTTV